MFEEIITKCKELNEKPRMALLTYLFLKFIDITNREPDCEELGIEYEEWCEKYGSVDYDNFESLIYVL